MEEEGIERFGKIHHTIWGDAGRNVDRIINVAERMFRRRGASTLRRMGEVTQCVRESRGRVLCAEGGGGIQWDLYIHEEDRVGVRFARTVLTECEERGSRAVVVSTEGPTPFTRKECEGRPIQFFLASDMCVDLVEHCLVPKHEVVDAPPANLRPEQLPRMDVMDKVAQYYDWKPGTIIKITRVFGGSEPIPYYRLVVPTLVP